MELVLLWYKMQRRAGLVIQSLLLTTTQQLPNKCPLLYSTMPMLNSRTFQSASGVNTITRPIPRRSGGDYPSGQLSGPLPTIDATRRPHQVSRLQLVHVSRVLGQGRGCENKGKEVCT